MPSDNVGDLLNEIGILLGKDPDYPREPTLLHAEVDTNYVGPSIFKNLGNQILYRREDMGLMYVLLDLWEENELGKRWSEIEYLLHDGKFEVVFVYPEEIDPKEDSMDRRDRIVRRYFGDKPIVYPPWPGDVGGQPFDL